MIHFSCDLCGGAIDATFDRRFVVKVDVFAAGAEGGDFDADPVEDLEAELVESSTGRLPADGLPDCQSMRYDLCAACRERYLADPLRGGRKKHLHFSEN